MAGTGTAAQRETLGRVVVKLLAYRGASPESVTRNYPGGDPPLAASTIRRIIQTNDPHLDDPRGELKLLRLSGMLGVPPATLSLVYAGDISGVRKLAFADEALKQFIIDEMQAKPAPARPRKQA